MTRTWWVKRLFGAPNRPARRSRPTARPSLTHLEDRTAPAALTEADAGKTLVVTLNEANEALTVVSGGATYSFTTTGTKFTNGGVSAPADFTGIDTQNLTLQASGLLRYDTVRVVDTAAGAKVTFNDSGANKYSDQFEVTLDNTSAGIVFNLASDYDTKAALLVTDATLSVSSGATVAGSGGLTFRAKAIAIDTSGAPGTVNGTGGRVTITPFAAADAVQLGGADAAGVLGLTAAEVARITAGVLQVGDPTNTGGVALTDDVSVSAGTATLALQTGGAVTQTVGKTLTVSQLAVTGASVALDTGSHAVATVAGRATTGDFAFKSGSSPGLTVGTVDAIAGVTATGQVTIRSVNALTVSAPVQAGTTIALTVADGNPAGRTATVPGSFLTAPNGTTITGGAGSDTFNISASANSKIDVNGGLPSAPASPGDTLSIDAQSNPATVKYQGADLTKGTVKVAALEPIGFQQIETLKVLNSSGAETVLDGTAGNDVLVMTKAGGAVVFTLNGLPPVPVAGTKFTFNGLAGDDRMLVDFGGGDPALTDGITFNGGGNTDTLQVQAGGRDGSYRPSGADSGTVTVGSQKIAFATAERVDAFAALTFSVVFPGADDILTVANGKDFGSNTIDALVVSSPAAAFAPVALRGNGQVTIDTADAGGADGNDTITIISANNAHANSSLTIRTGTGTDTVTINGPVSVTGFFTVDSVAIDVNANITAGVFVHLIHTGALRLAGVTLSGTAGVIETGGGAVTLTSDVVVQSAAAGVAFAGAIDAAVAGGQSLTVTGVTTVDLGGSVGNTNRLKSLNMTGAEIGLFAAAYKTQLGQTYTGPVVVEAAAVLFDAGGAVTFTGTLDRFIAGASAVTVAAGGAATFGGPVGGTKALASLAATAASIAVNGGLVRTTGGQTYNSPVTVGQGTTFESTGGGAVAFKDTLSGAFPVAVNTAGTTSFAKAVTVGSLTTDAGGTTAVNGGSVTTSGGQGYGDPVTVGANTTFSSTGAGAIGFGGSLNGGFTVTINTAGTTSFFGPVGDAVPLASLTTNVVGTTQVNGGLVQTTGGQTFNDPVGVGADATFASTGGGNVLFNVTLDGPGGAAVNTAGTTLFAGAVGGGTPLVFLSTDAGGTTLVNGGLVGTAGDQTFGDGVTVGTNTLFTTTAGGGVAFASTLTGAGLNVTVNVAGPSAFGGAVFVGTLTTDTAGTTALSTTSVTTAGVLTFGDAVLLQAPGGGVTVVTSVGNGDVTFASAVDGPGGLAVVTGGTTTFAGPVGGTTPLASLSTVAGGATVIGGGLVRTTAQQGYGDAVVLAAGATFTAGTLVHFDQTLAGAFGVVTNSPQVTFRKAVDVGQLTVNAAAGPFPGVFVNGPSVASTFGQSYALPVTATDNVTFVSPAGNATFGQALGGGFNVSVITPGATVFGGPVDVGSLITDTSGLTVVAGGSVTTAGIQAFHDPVQAAGAGATFTSAGGDVLFHAALTAEGQVRVNTPGTGRFGGAVGVGVLETDAPGVTVVATGLVRAGPNATFRAGGMTFRDVVNVAVPVTFQTGGNAVFGSALGGLVDVVVLSPGATVFGGPVHLASLATDAAGSTAVNGGVVATTGGQSYGDLVGVGADTTFASTGGAGVVFGQSISGPGRAVAVNTAGATVFAGFVRVGSLTTDVAGTTAVNGGSVVTDVSQVFNDPVTVGAAALFAAGDQVRFVQTLSGPVGVVVNASGATTFGGLVSLASLATDAAGITVVNTGLVQTSGGQEFGDAVAVNVAATFAGAALTFRSNLSSGNPVVLASGGDVNFFAPVAVGSLATDAGGRTIVRGGSVDANTGQSYGDHVLLAATARLATAGGDLSFLGRLDAEAAGAQGLTAVAPAGTLLFAGAVGSTGPVAFLVADAVMTRLAADFRATEDVAVTARGGGVEQSAGFLNTATLGLFGSGTYTLDQLGTRDAGNDVTGTFRANVSGPIRLADYNNLTVDAAGIVTGNNTALIRTGRDFTAEDLRGDGRYSTPLINVGDAEFLVDPGHFGSAMVTFDAEIDPVRAVFGLPNGANKFADEFRIRPSKAVPIEVNGNAPGLPLLGQPPDVLVPLFAGAEIAGFTFDGSNGVYTFNDRAPLSFTGIESLARRALAGFVVQTGEPRDATGAAQVQYAVRIVQTQGLQAVVDGKVVVAETPIPLPGGLDGGALLENPFVVAPALVNPASPNAAPRVAFGDVNGDGAIDLILANGPGTSPLVTVVDGLALNAQADGTLRKLEDLVQQGQVLAQFYAYDPRFLGGVNVTTADLDGDGSAEVITGAEQGGGPHVRVFNIKKGGDIGFFVYEPTFTGGVRVAAADVNGDGTADLVLGAGLNGGPRVTVVDGKTLAETGNRAEIANFFAYDPAFRGGIYVDAGDYDNDGFADILTGPGVGGGSHVRVFSGRALAGPNPAELAGFFAFTQTVPDNPLFTPGTPASGVGGVAFSGTSANGSRNILVGTGRGPQVQVKEFRGNGRTPTESVDLLKDQQFVVQGVNPETRVPNPIIFPLPSLLGYGASVGGFADPFAE